LIIEKVAEAKKNTSMSKICSGLWVSIGKELNREPELMLHKWNRKLSKVLQKLKSELLSFLLRGICGGMRTA